MAEDNRYPRTAAVGRTCQTTTWPDTDITSLSNALNKQTAPVNSHTLTLFNKAAVFHSCYRVVSSYLLPHPRHSPASLVTPRSRWPHLQQQKLVERVVPLHQEDARRHCAAQVLVAVEWVAPHTAALTAFGVGHLSEMEPARSAGSPQNGIGVVTRKTSINNKASAKTGPLGSVRVWGGGRVYLGGAAF